MLQLLEDDNMCQVYHLTNYVHQYFMFVGQFYYGVMFQSYCDKVFKPLYEVEGLSPCQFYLPPSLFPFISLGTFRAP